MYFKKLSGIKCYLSPIDVNDAETYTRWLNDPEITENLTLASALISFNGEKEILQKPAADSLVQQGFTSTIKSIMSELRMPAIRAACPRVRGRTVSSFCRVSAERAGIEA